MKVAISAYVEPEIKAAIEEIAKKTRRSQAQIIAILIERGLNNDSKTEDKKEI